MKYTTLKFYIFISLILISFQGITSINVTQVDTTVNCPTEVGEHYYNLDINNDGIVDYTLVARNYYPDVISHYDTIYAWVVMYKGPALNGINTGPFDNSQTIDDGLDYASSNVIYGIEPGLGSLGQWPGSLPSTEDYAYMGCKFEDASGNVYYGWVQLKTNGKSFTVLNFAYNTSPNAPITAGQLF